MSRLVVNPGTSQAWEIHLKPGANFLGRGETNDFTINDPSVSGSHCQVHVNQNSVVIKDSGSTNGTFVTGTRVQEKQLEHGQPLKLGGVDMIFYADATTTAAHVPTPAPIVVRVSPIAVRPAVAVAPVAVATAAPPPPAVPAGGSLRVAKLTEAKAAPTATPVAAPQELPADIDPQKLVGPRYCKYHPSSPGRQLCPKCDRTYCDMCIDISEIGGHAHHTCRTCGTEVLAYNFRLPPAKSFYSKLPAAFGYPFKGAGIVILIFATIAFAALRFVSGGIFGFFIKGSLLGFVFLFMQNIILTTTSDEKEGLGFPEPSGLGGAAFQLIGTVVASFWLLIALFIAKFEGVDIPGEALIAAEILGALYCPMALLAVAMKDSVIAANPLVVIPAMVKAPGKYAVTAGLSLAVYGVRQLGETLSSHEGHVGLMTKSVNEFMVAAGIQMIWAVISVYLLVVTMRILGLFYNSSKQKLGWYSH